MSDLTKGDHQRRRVHATDGVMPTLGAEAGRGHNVPSILPGASRAKPEGDEQLSLLSILSVGDSRAKITQLQESAAAWLATVARSGGKCTGPLLSAAPHGLSEKMYLGSCPVTEEPISLPSSSRLFNSGMASPGLLLTLNTSEWRNDGDACSLSDILEESPDPKYSLSPKACAGILRRAEKQGRELTPALGSALRAATTNEET
mgnify:CR=1 FL=1